MAKAACDLQHFSASPWRTPASTPHSWEGADSLCVSPSSAQSTPGQARASVSQIGVLRGHLKPKINVSHWLPFRKWELWIFLLGSNFFYSMTEGTRTHCVLQPAKQGRYAPPEAIKLPFVALHNHSLPVLVCHKSQLSPCFWHEKTAFSRLWFYSCPHILGAYTSVLVWATQD